MPRKNSEILLVAITGGIGSGKSVVSRVLRVMGYEVYDCDLEAKRLIDSSAAIKSAIAKEIGEDCVDSTGCVNRKRIAEIVFADSAKLETLNRLTHGAVRDDLEKWKERAGRSRGICFVETAILYESGLDRMVDEVWDVTAPVELRIERVMKRNGHLREQVEARIASQNKGGGNCCRHHNVHEILNDGVTPVLPEIEKRLRTHPTKNVNTVGG